MKKIHKSSVFFFTDYYLNVCNKIHNQKVLKIYSSFNIANSTNRITDSINLTVYKKFNKDEN
jgi:hypothetical protein